MEWVDNCFGEWTSDSASSSEWVAYFLSWWKSERLFYWVSECVRCSPSDWVRVLFSWCFEPSQPQRITSGLEWECDCSTEWVSEWVSVPASLIKWVSVHQVLCVSAVYLSLSEWILYLLRWESECVCASLSDCVDASLSECMNASLSEWICTCFAE